VCVALLDLDHFKRVNDTLGHAGGDELLAATGVAWRGVLRDVDLLARWGGEEFAVALPACDLDDALEVVGRLRAAVPGDHTTSAGVALWDGMESADALLGRADAALYRAKANGRDRAEAAPARPRAPIT
jgi:diguanylate cyclase (GGDEF)-like protein